MNNSRKDTYSVEINTHVTGANAYKGKRYYVVTHRLYE